MPRQTFEFDCRGRLPDGTPDGTPCGTSKGPEHRGLRLLMAAVRRGRAGEADSAASVVALEKYSGALLLSARSEFLSDKRPHSRSLLHAPLAREQYTLSIG